MSDEQNDKINLAKKLKERGIDERLMSIGAVQAAAPEAAVTWDVPVHDVDLPSRGLVYPKESSLHGKTRIEIRSMTAKEEDILTSRSLLRQGKAMTMLLKNCMIDKSIDPDEMLTGDRNALLVAIRMSGYGPEYQTKIECPVCSNQFDHEFNVGEISKVKELGSPPDEIGQNSFTLKLPVSNKEVKFKLMTGADDKDLNLAAERQKKVMGSDAAEPNVTLRLFHSIVSVGNEMDRGKIKRFVDNMPARDSIKLRKHIENISPGLDMKTFVMCPECGEESEVDMPIGAEFFWPDIS